ENARTFSGMQAKPREKARHLRTCDPGRCFARLNAHRPSRTCTSTTPVYHGFTPGCPSPHRGRRCAGPGATTRSYQKVESSRYVEEEQRGRAGCDGFEKPRNLETGAPRVTRRPSADAND